MDKISINQFKGKICGKVLMVTIAGEDLYRTHIIRQPPTNCDYGLCRVVNYVYSFDGLNRLYEYMTAIHLEQADQRHLLTIECDRSCWSFDESELLTVWGSPVIIPEILDIEEPFTVA